MDTLSPPPPPPPHVLIFPLPLQGPIKCMLNLAELLSLSGLHVTFLNTHHSHAALLRHTAILPRFSLYPHFRFQTVPDGLPDDHPRTGDRIMELFDGLEAAAKPAFGEILASREERPVTCVIADGALTFALEVAEEVGVPLIYFDTVSPCGLWTYFCVPKLIDAGEFPFKGKDLDEPIRNVPGMEGILRRRDLPSFCRTKDVNDPIIEFVKKEAKEVPRSLGLILNTSEDLDAPVLYHMRAFCPNLYVVGPLHSHLKMRLEAESKLKMNGSSSLWREDGSCIAWLDKQPQRSVVYISIGSLAVMTWDQLLEFWYGVVNSGHRFLWVKRPNSVSGQPSADRIPAELLEATDERGCFVSWAPQEEVLAHPAVGAFITHSGWNSTLESMMERVPMICWPYFVDQQPNSRFVDEVWKVGLDMKDACDRVMIERMIRDLMEVRREELVDSMDRYAMMARRSISEGGSSCLDLKRLIEDIQMMKV